MVSSTGRMYSLAGSGLYCSTSIGPSCSVAASSAARSESPSRTFAAKPCARYPDDRSSAASASSRSWLREMRAMSKPSRPKRSATASPRPLPAPTMAMVVMRWSFRGCGADGRPRCAAVRVPPGTPSRFPTGPCGLGTRPGRNTVDTTRTRRSRRTWSALGLAAVATLGLTACSDDRAATGPDDPAGQRSTASPPADLAAGQLAPDGRTTDVVSGLEAPWSVVPVGDDGDALVSERDSARVLELRRTGRPARSARSRVSGTAARADSSASRCTTTTCSCTRPPTTATGSSGTT